MSTPNAITVPALLVFEILPTTSTTKDTRLVLVTGIIGCLVVVVVCVYMGVGVREWMNCTLR